MSKLEKLIVPQAAALPIAYDNSRIRVLLITSRETKRWVIPKGWLMRGKKPWEVAELEALEEAGAVGVIAHKAIGTFQYTKLLPRGESRECEVSVYPMRVERLKNSWKESGERSRKWFSPKKAAKLVAEPELSKLILSSAEARIAQLLHKNNKKAS